MDKKIIIVIVLVLLIVGGGGGYYFLSSSKTQPKEEVKQDEIVEEEVVPTISSKDLNLVMTLRPDKKAVKFEMKNPGDLELVEYQISYTKEINGEEVPEGLIGETKVEPNDPQIAIAYREFGTCSRNVCRYDKVVSAVKLTLKITKTNGKVLSAEDTIDL